MTRTCAAHRTYSGPPHIVLIHRLGVSYRTQRSILHPLQGWLSSSIIGLKVLPFLKEAIAYIILGPFFRSTARAERISGANR